MRPYDNINPSLVLFNLTVVGAKTFGFGEANHYSPYKASIHRLYIMRGFVFPAAALMPRRPALPALLLLCALLCSACATRGEPGEVPETDLATPEAAAAKAQALPRPEGLSDDDFPAWLQGERERIARERDAAQTILTTREAKCWRRFAVNACLQRARRAERDAMNALLQQELALNAHERAHRARHVEQRLEEKAASKEKEGK